LWAAGRFQTDLQHQILADLKPVFARRGHKIEYFVNVSMAEII